VEDYILTPSLRTPEDVARDDLRGIVNEIDAELLTKHLNLYAYGRALMEQQNTLFTDYGLIGRRDGQPILTQSDILTQEIQMF
jgi:hypothetical protein